MIHYLKEEKMILKKKIHQDHSGPPQLDPLVYMKKQKQKKTKTKTKMQQ